MIWSYEVEDLEPINVTFSLTPHSMAPLPKGVVVKPSEDLANITLDEGGG